MEAVCMFLCFGSQSCRAAYHLAYPWIKFGEASVGAAVRTIPYARKRYCSVRVQEKHVLFLSHVTSHIVPMMSLRRIS